MGGDEEAFETWLRLRAGDPHDAHILALYELVAAARGVRAHELPATDRRELALRAFRAVDPSFEVANAGEDSEPVVLVPYDPGWPARFEGLRDRFERALGAAARRIDHVGSTAVPGLAAKPVIDVQVSVLDLGQEDTYVPALNAAGVRLHHRDSEHRFLLPPETVPRDVHVHVCAAGSRLERRHVLFRDHLRATPAARDAYRAAKDAAAREWSDDRFAYTEAKGEVIRGIALAAESWAAATGWTLGG